MLINKKKDNKNNVQNIMNIRSTVDKTKNKVWNDILVYIIALRMSHICFPKIHSLSIIQYV